MNVHDVNVVMMSNHLRIAKELIQTKYGEDVLYIRFEDGSGSKFIVAFNSEPSKQHYISL